MNVVRPFLPSDAPPAVQQAVRGSISAIEADVATNPKNDPTALGADLNGQMQMVRKKSTRPTVWTELMANGHMHACTAVLYQIFQVWTLLREYERRPPLLRVLLGLQLCGMHMRLLQPASQANPHANPHAIAQSSNLIQAMSECCTSIGI